MVTWILVWTDEGCSLISEREAFGFRTPCKTPHILGLKRRVMTKYRPSIETKIDGITSKLTWFPYPLQPSAIFYGEEAMTDQQLALQAVSEAQRLLEEYLQPRPQDNERRILDQLVEVLERPDLVVAVGRLQQRSSL
jgi:hypothetical protein